MKFTGKDGTLRIYDRLAGYVEVHFRNLDFSGPIGRTKLEETLVLDNGNLNDFAHYINGSDMVLYDPMPISFSCFIESVTGVEPGVAFNTRNTVEEALTCRFAEDVHLGHWIGWGASTKGTTKNNGIDFNPLFDIVNPSAYLSSSTITDTPTSTTIEDNTLTLGVNEGADWILTVPARNYASLIASATTDTFTVDDFTAAGVTTGDTYFVYENIRTVNVEFKMLSLTGLSLVYKYNEVYFPPNEITMAEAEDSITLTAAGGVYGTIVRATDFS